MNTASSAARRAASYLLRVDKWNLILENSSAPWAERAGQVRPGNPCRGWQGFAAGLVFQFEKWSGATIQIGGQIYRVKAAIAEGKERTDCSRNSRRPAAIR